MVFLTSPPDRYLQVHSREHVDAVEVTCNEEIRYVQGLFLSSCHPKMAVKGVGAFSSSGLEDLSLLLYKDCEFLRFGIVN